MCSSCVMQFWRPDDEHMCLKRVEAWNKLIVKQKSCASSWLITEIKKKLGEVFPTVSSCATNPTGRPWNWNVPQRWQAGVLTPWAMTYWLYIYICILFLGTQLTCFISQGLYAPDKKLLISGKACCKVKWNTNLMQHCAGFLSAGSL